MQDGLSKARLEQALGMVEASYWDLLLFRDRYAPEVPIFAHCYDFPLPTGIHPLCAGPWLKPSIDYCGWNQDQGEGIIKETLVRFRQLLLSFAQSGNNFILVDTQGLLNPLTGWANELHPTPSGFKLIAEQFLMELRRSFSNRI